GRGGGGGARRDLVRLLGSRAAAPEEGQALGARAGAALRGGSPEARGDFGGSNTKAMPFLSPALKRFLEEYPWTTDGLSRSERRLLSIASSGPVELITAFSLMHQGETAYYITDLSLLSLLKDFSRASQPLLSISGEQQHSERHRRDRRKRSRDPQGRARSRRDVRHRSMVWRNAHHWVGQGVALGRKGGSPGAQLNPEPERRTQNEERRTVRYLTS